MQIAETKVVGEILIATNVTNPCIRKTVKKNLLIANVIQLMKPYGLKRRLVQVQVNIQ
ncbi:MAG: hypothetical protein R3237_03365 [Nitrosopumilaceae archaeon]|nr:hypothetical protein [Nitrosopumilaceae archaeon]